MNPQEREPGIGLAVRQGVRSGVTKAVGTVVTVALLSVVGLSHKSSGSDPDKVWISGVAQSFASAEHSSHPVGSTLLPEGRLDVFTDASGIRKLVLSDQEGRTGEFYFSAGKLTFVYEHAWDEPSAANASPTRGNRFYFRQSGIGPLSATKMFLWRAPGRTVVDAGSAEFKAAEQRLMERAARLMQTATGK